MTPETIELILEHAEGIGLAVLTCNGPPEAKADLIRNRLDALGYELSRQFPDAWKRAYPNGGTR